MFLLDTKTLVWILTFTTAFLGITLSLTLAPRFQRGEKLWIASLFVLAFAEVLLLGRGEIPDFASIVIANTLQAVSLALAYLALGRLLVQPTSWIPVGVPVATCLVVFPILIDNLIGLIIASGVIFSLQHLLVLQVILKADLPYGRQSRWVLAAGYVTGALMFAVRTGMAIVDPSHFSSTFSTSGAQSVSLLIGLASVILISTAFIVIHRDFMDFENQRLATLDPLTELFNRRTLLELAGKELAASQRAGRPLSLLMLDLDHFKEVNDTWGHLVGDRVLIGVADTIRAVLRQQDVVGRYGGEEFCVVLPNTGADGARLSADRLCEAIGARTHHAGKSRTAVTVSIGIATLAAGVDITMDDLVGRADNALYAAKNAGRNRVFAAPLDASERLGPATA